MSSLLKLSKFAACVLSQLCRAEEESILKNASVVDHGYFESESPEPQELIGDGFLSLIEVSHLMPNPPYFAIDFGAPNSKKVRSVFILNVDCSENLQSTILLSHIRAGNDSN